ncbi:zinc finger protein 479-like [Mizuhopecten yessoensis]|uniref:zinc finger protein 479-like n=1 Tax=Mizuhopecten yessoensis TaxID=6573 RepID=UPI000B4595FD|nr:zinc finger protein 479-like [Mizuhopecten yessoensis]
MEKLKLRFHTYLKKILIEELDFSEEIKFQVSSDICVDNFEKISFLWKDQFLKSTHREDFLQIQRTVLQDVVGCTELSTLRDIGLVFLKPLTNAAIQTEPHTYVHVEIQTDQDRIYKANELGSLKEKKICQDVSTQTDFEDKVSVSPDMELSVSTPSVVQDSVLSDIESISPPIKTTGPPGKRLRKLTINLVSNEIKTENCDSDYEPPEFGETTDDNSDTGGDQEVVVIKPTPVMSPDDEKSASSLRQEELTCPLCPSKFRSQQGAEKHLRVKHDIGNVYICKICQDICPSNTAMHEHMITKHGIEDLPAVEKRRKRRRKNLPQTFKKAKVSPIQKPMSKLKSKNTRKKRPASGGNKPDVIKHKCSHCPKLFNAVTAMQRHMRANHQFSAVQKCNQCSKTYLSARALRRHITTTHQFSRHQCELCGKEFTSKESLYHHKRGLHSDSKPYKCEQCGASFNFNHSLRLHQLKHTGKRPHKCTLCDKSYLTSNHLKMHVEGVHGNKKKYSCSICGKAFSYTTSLRVHEMSHGNIRPYKCKSCGLGFINSHALKYHTESKHAADLWFTCDICGKEYKTEFLMKTHRRRHTADGTRFMCDICGHLFMYKSTLEIHAAVHSEEKAFQCSTCGKSFKTYATLYSHQYVHKTEMPYECQDCGKAFKTKERCKAHQRRHLGLKPFDCDQCGRCFPDKGGLTKHKKTVHCVEKKHVCSYCGKACSRADNLRVHMKVHEKNTTNPGKNVSGLAGSGVPAPVVRKSRSLAKIDAKLTTPPIDNQMDSVPVYRVESELDRITSEHGYERLIENLIDRTMDKPGDPKLTFTQTRPNLGGSVPPTTSVTPGGESLGSNISPVPISPPLPRVYTDPAQSYESESGPHIVPLPIAMTSQDGPTGLQQAPLGVGTPLPSNTTALPLPPPPPSAPYMYMWPYMHPPNQSTSQSHESNFY